MKKLLTSLLCVMMAVCFMPAMAWADGEPTEDTTEETTYAVSIGEQGYSTVGAAINAAGTSATTIRVVADTTENVVIPTGADITLNIEENVTLTNSGSNHTITNNGTLTITGKGTVENKNTSAKGALYNAPGATVNLNGCTFTGDKWYVIKNFGTMTIDGAAVIQNDAGSSGIDNGY